MEKRSKRVIRKSIVIPIAILVFVIIFDLVFIYIMKHRQIDSKKDMQTINDNYPKFESAAKQFSTVRDELYKNKENDFYLETMKSKVDFWNDYIVKYGTEVDKVEAAAKTIKDECSVIYANSAINEKCYTFNGNYEASINSYVADISLYNKFANEFNKENSEKKLQIIESKYKYIDANKDNVYTGKLEGVENE